MGVSFKTVRRTFILSIPIILTIAIFISTFFLIVIPYFSKSMIDSRRRMTKELTTNAWQVVNSFYTMHKNGELSEERAKKLAMLTLRRMKYGPEGKDYFWINDMQPVMIMHPYRTDLEGVNVKEVKDPAGTYLFKEFIKTAKEKEEGYVDYMWQWKDDKTRIVPKVSYIKYFAPWKWIIGTGIYLEDVQTEIAFIIQQLEKIFLLILIVLIGISIFIIWRNEKAALLIEKLNLTLERKVQERTLELEESLDRLKNLQVQMVHVEKMSSLGQMAAGIAHEINNPVGFVLSNIGMMKEYTATLKATVLLYEQLIKSIHEKNISEIHNLIKKIDQVTQQEDIDYVLEDLSPLLDESFDGIIRIRDIVQNLKNFSRLDDDQQITPSDINQGIESTLKIIHNELKYKCKVELELGDLPLVECNLGQMNQVFMNLLSNAAHAIEKEGTVSIKTRHQENHVVITICDTGCGISKENLAKLFDPFYTTKEVGEGTGLGLSIVHGIIQSHSGDIKVESEVGKGTCFTIQLPIHCNSENIEKKEEA